MDNKELFQHAYDLFQQQKYDQALEIYVVLYNKGYEKEWIKTNIYSCYVEGNEKEFRDTYKKSKKCVRIKYEECALDFIPYQEGKYYIYDKKKEKFVGIFSMDELKKQKPDQGIKNIEFGSIGIATSGIWSELLHILCIASKRKIYMICPELERNSSFYKIPELADFMKNVQIFSSIQEFQQFFHQNIEQYLPTIIYGKSEDQKTMLEIVHNEHEYRLTKEGRSTKNVLLTIGIPSYHRGNLVLKRLQNLCKMNYDAEIEFVISKNGTGIYQKEYDSILELSDARINYFDHQKDLKPEINWHYVVEMAHGKYVMFVSDEDDVVLGALDHYLAFLQNNQEVNLIRAKTEYQYSMVDACYGKKGLDAFEKSFLSQSYLSGLIIKREDFLNADLLAFEKYSDNLFYQDYPHEWWCVEMNKRGDYLMDSEILISEQESVLAKEEGYSEANSNEQENFIPIYATYEHRLKQFVGMVDYLCKFMDGKQEWLKTGMDLVMRKVAWLFFSALDRKHDMGNYEQYAKEYEQICKKSIEKLEISIEYKKYLNNELDYIVKNMKSEYDSAVSKK